MLPSLGLAICCYLFIRLATLPNKPDSRVTLVMAYLGAVFVALCAFDIFISSVTIPK